jgi:hypothetical protein
MMVALTLGLVVGLVGGWVYAGCPAPGAVRRAVSARGRVGQEQPVEGISSEPAQGASTATP